MLVGCLELVRVLATHPEIPYGRILEALGKAHLPAGFHPHDLGWLPLWLRAHEIQDLVLARADLYPSEVDAALDALVRPAGVRLWVVVERAVADAAAPVLGVEEEQCWSWGRFRARWSHQDRRRDPEEAVAIDPPLDLAAVWGAEHERLLRATTGAMGTDPYAIGFWEATSWSNGQAPSAARTAGRLRGLLARFDDPVCLVQAARGADVGPRPYGWEVRLDIGRIAGGPPRTPGPREATIRLSHVELGRDPCSTAVVALAAQRLRIQEIIELRIGDFAADVSSVLRRGDLVPLPPRARPLVRAQILTRLDQSAGPLDHLIASSRAPTVESITRMILATQRAIGDSLLAHTLRALPGQDERWLNEHGIWLAYRRAQERPALRPEGMDPELFRSMLVEVLKGEPRAPSRCACATEHPVPDPQRYLPIRRLETTRRRPRTTRGTATSRRHAGNRDAGYTVSLGGSPARGGALHGGGG